GQRLAVAVLPVDYVAGRDRAARLTLVHQVVEAVAAQRLLHRVLGVGVQRLRVRQGLLLRPGGQAVVHRGTGAGVGPALRVLRDDLPGRDRVAVRRVTGAGVAADLQAVRAEHLLRLRERLARDRRHGRGLAVR